ncbi:8-amino-7-oxononanoate synthase [uncultured Maritalea sp.]|uniref:8-amino-7-oxononanoate synthase n=1 Tax=uncultured Maritalea sp. TaxID=757249 RepID=UPI002626720B|nr:8-amino-7-oxononanoate synthase [uncultured Maritalea sp.]
MSVFPRHHGVLEALKNRARYRELIPRQGHDFASNDYIGLAGSDVLRQAGIDALNRGVPVGAGGSRLLRGNDAEHELLEHEAAAFFGVERTLFLGNGFVANMAIFSTLPLKDDLVLYDEYIHASAHEGMRLGRATTQEFAHNDAADAARKIQAWRAQGNEGHIWIACEAVYSMDGDLAPVAELYELAQQFGGTLIVDEAHATGVFGDLGRGLTHEIARDPNVLALHTCGKALGVSGALICGAAVLVETLINKARGFVFSTAPSPLNAALVRAALNELQTNPKRQLAALEQLKQTHMLAKSICGLDGLQSQILPVIIGEDGPTMAIAKTMQDKGYDIRGIRPPTVPKGTARLRISITLNTPLDVIEQMFKDLSAEMKKQQLPEQANG